MMRRTDESPANGLRSPLKWGLGATVFATLAALLWPAPAVVGVTTGHDVARPSSTSFAAEAHTDRALTAHAQSLPLAEAAAASASSVSGFDPFAGVAVTPPSPSPPAVSPALAAPPPPPPTQDYRYLGRMTGPDGSQQIILGRGETSISITKGMMLDNGYVVESISRDAVMLTYPSLEIRTSISIPTD